MLRRSQVFTLFVAIVFLIPCSAQAQSQGRGGYWDRGHWIGYVPPHLKQSTRNRQSDDTSADEAETSREQPVKRTQHTVPSQRVAKRTQPPRQQRRGGVVRTSHDMVGPIEMEGPMVERYGPGEPGGCGSYGDCGPGGDIQCGFGAACGPRRFWVRTDYLGWWTSGMDLPPLVTTSPDGTPQADAGVLGEPGTSILFGDSSVGEDGRSGGRFALGMWLDPCQLRGLDVTYMRLGTETTVYQASGTDYAILARPYHDILNNTENAHLIVFGTQYDGSVWVSAETQFQGLELLYRRALKRCGSNVDFLVGWRWLQLKDQLLISDSVTDGERQLAIDTYDAFDTANNFHGVEFGVEWERPLSCYWTLEVLGKLAIGNTHSLVRIDGQTTTVTGQGTTVVDGGLLALDSNMGTHARDSFAAVTEIGLSLKRRFHCGIEATFGYSLVYWSDVLRAGDQIDLNANLSQASGGALVGLAYPAVLLKSTDFWAQGLHFGLEYDF